MAGPHHYVFFVHGIGKHSKKWTKDPDNNTTLAKQIDDAWNLYPNSFKKLGNLSDNLILIPIYYDDLYGRLYKNWASQVETLKTNLKALPSAAGDLEKLVELIEKPSSGTANDDFFYTHVFDVLWYWGNTLIQDAIVAQVTDQILQKVKAHYPDSTSTFSIVGHSMGTSVVHKVLQRMYTEPEFEDQLPGPLKFQLLMQVANTSYVLSADRAGHYDTLVKPSGYAGHGVCWNMLNVNHKFDPIPAIIPFDPPKTGWIDDYSVSVKAYEDIQTERLTSRNVHSLSHYFENPLVHIPFFEIITGKRVFKTERKKQIEAFEARTPMGSFKQLKTQFEKLKDGDGSVFSFIKSARDYLKLVGTFV